MEVNSGIGKGVPTDGFPSIHPRRDGAGYLRAVMVKEKSEMPCPSMVGDGFQQVEWDGKNKLGEAIRGKGFSARRERRSWCCGRMPTLWTTMMRELEVDIAAMVTWEDSKKSVFWYRTCFSILVDLQMEWWIL